MRRWTAALLLVPALPGCGADAPIADPHAPEPGLWEVQVELAEVAPPRSEAETRAMVAALRLPLTERQCFAGRTPRVGDPVDDGRCRYSRIANSGPRTEREATCAGRGYRMKWSGARSAGSYDYWIETREAASGAGGPPRRVVVRERGRRLGPCPAAD